MALVIFSGCQIFKKALPSPGPLTAQAEIFMPPADVIALRVGQYAEEDVELSELERSSLVMDVQQVLQALRGPQPLEVEQLRPLTDTLYVAYRRYTEQDASLIEATRKGRLLSADILKDALSDVLNP